MTGKEEGSQKNKPPHAYYVLQEYKPLTRIMTCDYFLTHSSTSIERPQPLFGHPKESFLSVVTSIKQLCIKRLIHLFWICFKNTMKESTVQERRWRVWPYGLCIMALEWLGCNDSHNYQAAVSLHFVLFCFLFACCFVTCPWLEHHLKGFSTETTFRSITFFAKIVWKLCDLVDLVVKKKLLLSHWNQKLSFALFAQQKKNLHVRHRRYGLR